MIAFWGTAILRAVFDMGTGIGLYLEICSGRQSRKGWKKWALLVLLTGIFMLEVTDFNVVGTDVIIILALLTGTWLSLWTGTNWADTMIWYLFYKLTLDVLKMPVLIIQGLLREDTLIEANCYPDLWVWIVCCIITFIVFTIFCHWKKTLVAFFGTVIANWKWSLLLAGLAEFMLIIYLMNLVIWYQFNPQVFVLNVIGIVCLVLLLLVLFIRFQYQAVQRENRIVRSKEMLLQNDYALLKQAYDRNSQINHEHKHDLRFLYRCLQKKDWKTGLSYIEDKLECCYGALKEQIWTGCGSADFMLNHMKARADEKQIAFSVSVDITEVPVAEYDFFAILCNLLDNAFEAAEKCKENKYVKVKLHTVNDMFTLYIENSYAEEPKVRKGKFVTSKGGGDAHGWGIENVKEIVQRNHGVLDIRYADGMFSVQMVFGV